MSDGMDDLRKAHEEEYFRKQNEAALRRIQHDSDRNRPSPINGEAMEQVAYRGVVIDRCPKSGGIWLDNGELEQIVNAQIEEYQKGNKGFLWDFVKGLTGNYDESK